MTTDRSQTAGDRQALVERLFPQGIPRLWCPPLTHYTDSGGLDRRRIEAHLRWLAPFAPAWLVPGSTGDGWELSRDEIRQLLDLVLSVAVDQEAHVLIGALHPEATVARAQIQDTQAWLQRRAASADPAIALARNRVCGFAVCPPAGSDLSQAEISRALTSTLELNLPLALYQLPQVTQNEMAPETVAELAGRFANFYLFKDTSGQDRVATAHMDLDNLFLVRRRRRQLPGLAQGGRWTLRRVPAEFGQRLRPPAARAHSVGRRGTDRSGASLDPAGGAGDGQRLRVGTTDPRGECLRQRQQSHRPFYGSRGDGRPHPAPTAACRTAVGPRTDPPHRPVAAPPPAAARRRVLRNPRDPTESSHD